jgi:hypothetical protein
VSGGEELTSGRAEDRDNDTREQRRRRYAQGLPDYHDPLAGIGGAPPAQSALTLRLVLACFGLAFCIAAAIGFSVTAAPVGFTVASAVLAATAAVDIAVIVRRKRRGEPG